MILLLIAAQVAPPPPLPAPAAPAPAAWSILQPVDKEPCVPPRDATPADIVVCGQLPSQKLPYPELATDPPRGANPEMSGAGALAAEGTPCAARSGGCQVGVDVFGAGTALVRLAQKAVAPGSCCEDPGEGTSIVALGADIVRGVKRIGRKKPDTSNRVAIPLDDAPVDTTGKVRP